MDFGLQVGRQQMGRTQAFSKLRPSRPFRGNMTTVVANEVTDADDDGGDGDYCHEWWRWDVDDAHKQK